MDKIVHKSGSYASPTYKSWRSMKARCQNPSFSAFAAYGAKGITVCERWQIFANFLADMGERPEGMTLDRINGKGNYEPGNCRWATQTEQNHNRSISLIYEGKSLKELAESHGLKYQTVHNRITRLNWSVERALTTPLRRRQPTPQGDA